jgi:hypothetical protein
MQEMVELLVVSGSRRRLDSRAVSTARTGSLSQNVYRLVARNPVDPRRAYTNRNCLPKSNANLLEEVGTIAGSDAVLVSHTCRDSVKRG